MLEKLKSPELIPTKYVGTQTRTIYKGFSHFFRLTGQGQPEVFGLYVLFYRYIKQMFQFLSCAKKFVSKYLLNLFV